MKPWIKRIDEAETRGHFTKTDIRLANGWRSCAVGERAGGKIDDLGPSDDVLDMRGMDFARAVEHGEISDVRRAFLAIEKRWLWLKERGRV